MRIADVPAAVKYRMEMRFAWTHSRYEMHECVIVVRQIKYTCPSSACYPFLIRYAFTDSKNSLGERYTRLDLVDKILENSDAVGIHRADEARR
ncbi:hypothetical protein AZE42_02581 [Rhizopogon vesiculosus]|uniref:Uncharacterized protein n=1 Tax=Rhizopogon vesiculosus TaxID=180088 RepID=A0A1J8Q715_9AGAM|nr:hypothetical protein AZE42_02581 [Rhizopogon vesiculosus]